MAINKETGEVALFDISKVGFIHLRNDCSVGGGVFKCGDSVVLSKQVSATLVDAVVFKDRAFFTKKGKDPEPQDWIQLLFINNKNGVPLSTLIKTRSLKGFEKFVQAILAKKENPVGVKFDMQFADGTGVDDKGESFKYKYIVFEISEEKSIHKDFALELRAKLDSGEIQAPDFLG